MASITTRSPSKSQVAFVELFWVGPLCIGVTVLADLLVRTLATTFFGVPQRFVYLQAPFLMGSIAFFGVLATLVFALVARFARRPRAPLLYSGRHCPAGVVVESHHGVERPILCSGNEPPHLLDYDRDALRCRSHHGEFPDPTFYDKQERALNVF